MIVVGFGFTDQKQAHEEWKTLLYEIFRRFSDIPAPKIFRDENGKPRSDEAVFSPSHSGDIVMCAAFVPGGGSSLPEIGEGDVIYPDNERRFFRIPCESCAEIGADAEIVSDRRDEARLLVIAERYFTPGEIDEVRRGGKEAFYRVWTRKESLLKMTGAGMRAVRFADTIAIPTNCRMCSFGISQVGNEYSAAVCFETTRNHTLS